jgi:hypothetical protein
LVADSPVISQIPSPGGPIYHLQEYYYRLGLGDRTNIARAFRGIPLISDPRFGEVETWPGFETYVSSSAAWLAEKQARFTPCESITNPLRHILEGRLSLGTSDPGKLILVSLVGEVFSGGLKRLRIYHGPDPEDTPPARRNPLPAHPGLSLPGSVEYFLRALTAGDSQGMRAAFSSDARLVSPGANSLDEFLESAVKPCLQHWLPCTLTSSGHRHVLEYNCSVQDEPMPAAGGCAVFELAPDGLIERLRIYPA